MSARHIRCGPFANESERYATEFLRIRLESSASAGQWILLSNHSSSVSARHLSDEVDVVVVGPPGVILVEVKHWSSRDLKRIAQHTVEHEAIKLNDKAKRLGGKLRNECKFNIGFVTGKFLFTKTENEKFTDGTNRVGIRGTEVFGLTEWRKLLGLDRPPLLSDTQIKQICSVLEPRAEAVLDNEVRVFGDFFDLELVSLASDRFHRVYRARRKNSRDKVVLHLYDLSATKEKNAYDIASREFEVLQRLQKSQWLPSLMDTFREAVDYPGELYFFSYVDPEAASLAERARDHDWQVSARIHTAKRCVEALLDIHQRGIEDAEGPIFHRNLTPQSIRIRSNGEPLLTELHFAKLSGATTLTGSAAQEFVGSEGFVSPEVLASGLGASTAESDVYSLCASLLVLFQGIEKQPLLTGTVEVLRGGMMEEPSDRCGLEALLAQLEGLPEQVTEQSPVSVRFWDEETIKEFRDCYYRIKAKLGEGSVGTTFKVMEVDPSGVNELSGPYVAKAITNPTVGEAAARAYAKVRAQTGVPHLAGVLEVTREWKANEITALLKWVQGDPLSEWTGVLPLYLDELGEDSREEVALRWLRDLCEGLGHLHQAGLVHGDVSPRNIIVDGGNVTLTDFDLAGATGQIPLGGTTLYCSPDVDARISVATSDDDFALATSLFHVLFDRPPFQYPTGLDKKRGINWVGVDRDGWPRVARFMDLATYPDRIRRFKSALDAICFLETIVAGDLSDESASSTAEAHQVWTDNEVPWFRLLLQSYPGSPKGNVETRGLDSEFAKLTYVETRLDSLLAQDIRDRKVGLVILCGNAGDGKTAFLQNLASTLGLRAGASAQRIWDCTLDDGLTVRANLDGSAAYQGKPANQLLNEFFAPFQTNDFPSNLVHLVAINDGPLLQWLNDSEDTYLTDQLRAALDEEDSEELDGRIRFIDLNARSLVGGCSPGSSALSTEFLDELLEKLLGGAQDTWAPCKTCTAQTRCHAWRSVSSLRDQNLGPILRERLTRAFRAVHQRGEIHITARGLRAAVVYIFFGTYDCADLHHDPNLRPEHYYDRAFDSGTENRQGELLAELRWLDPALESHPPLDRYLLRDEPDAETDPRGRLRSLRRRAYFEWPESKIREVGGSVGSLDLARGRHHNAFLRVGPGTEKERDAICSDLCEGVSRLEDLPEGAYRERRWVPLKITPRTPTETAFWVNKRRERFSLRARWPHAVDGVETLHTHIILAYEFESGEKEELVIGAELFHLLMEIKEGLSARRCAVR